MIRDEPVGDEELAGSRRYISGLFPFDIETNSDIAQWMTDLEFYRLGGDFVEKYRSRIDAVSSEGIMRVANEHFGYDGNLIVVMTNYEETKEGLEWIRNLSRKGITAILVEHDMSAVMSISERIVVINFGTKIAEGAPSEVQKNKTVVEAYLGVDHEEIA